MKYLIFIPIFISLLSCDQNSSDNSNKTSNLTNEKSIIANEPLPLKDREYFHLEKCYTTEYQRDAMSAQIFGGIEGEWVQATRQEFNNERYINQSIIVDLKRNTIAERDVLTDKTIKERVEANKSNCEQYGASCDKKIENEEFFPKILSSFNYPYATSKFCFESAVICSSYEVNLEEATYTKKSTLAGEQKHQCKLTDEVVRTPIAKDPYKNIDIVVNGTWTKNIQLNENTGNSNSFSREGLVKIKIVPLESGGNAILQTSNETAFRTAKAGEYFTVKLTDTGRKMFNDAKPETKTFTAIINEGQIIGVSNFYKSSREDIFDYSNANENVKKRADINIKHFNAQKIFIDPETGFFSWGRYDYPYSVRDKSWFKKYYLDNYDMFPHSDYDLNILNNNGAFLVFGGEGYVEPFTMPDPDGEIPTPLFVDKDPNELVAVASGSGFFINKQGNIVTNEHVVEGCNNMKIIIDGEEIGAEVIATDNVNDLALLKTEFKNNDYFKLSKEDVDRSQPVKAIGYGFGKNYSSDIKVTAGIVNSLSGYNDNYSEFQMDAAIQSGNSGGPVINEEGQVVGVSVAALDSIAVLEDTGTLPQNVNYAIKTSTLKQFLNSKDIHYEESGSGLFSFFGNSNDSINDLIDDASVYLSCYMTYAQIEENMTTKVMFENIE